MFSGNQWQGTWSNANIDALDTKFHDLSNHTLSKKKYAVLYNIIF